ncbi:ATP-binding protein [Peribacillus sp. SCS-155]|uniref:ATP-binding protein n=1 Tax=Peribacillus sedimenti TaxID=3115297 RepID=UPI003905FEF0
MLINFLFLLLPVTIFLIFFENRLNFFLNYNSKFFLFILAAITMMLCMEFPIKLDIGYIVDLRYIPFIIVSLFGGYRLAFPLYLILNIHRFIIGGEGFLPSFVFSTVIFALVPSLKNTFLQFRSRSRTVCAAVVSFLTISLYLVILPFTGQVMNREYWILFTYSITTYVVVMVIIISMIQQIIRNTKARQSMIQTEKLNLISELSASVSHEIRNPLTVTSGFLQLINKSKNISYEEKGYIGFALQELRRAENIVSDFLAFAKPQSEYMVYSNLKEEVEYVKNIITPYANMNDVDIKLSFTNTLNITYDKNQIQQCMLNLYKNGIEAMKENGGTLHIEVKNDNENNIIIEIKDDGYGMTREEIMMLGNPYYSTKKEGTGLGMLMVYSTVNKVKGKIHIESEKGKGTLFRIIIPV